MAHPLPTLPAVGNPCRAHRCSACCHDTEMLLTEADAAHLTAAGHAGGWEEADDGFLQLRLRSGPPAPGMAGRPCWYLSPGGACTVYDDRPEGCRLYPAVHDGRAILDDEHCPHTAAFRLTPDASAAVRALADRLVRERDARAKAKRS